MTDEEQEAYDAAFPVTYKYPSDPMPGCFKVVIVLYTLVLISLVICALLGIKFI